jgi:photosystem II stability/assembly factor-like uncharacterized protein
MKSIKYTALLLGIIVMCLSEIYAQRQRISTLKSSEINYDYSGGLWFPDANTGIAVGMDWNDSTSLILRTEDAGVTWNPTSHPKINNGVWSYIYDISFSDSMNGWVAGQTGAIMNTKDGGKTWTKISFPRTTPIMTVFCLDSITAWAGILGPIYYHTADEGKLWASKTTELETFPWDIFFFNADTGITVGGWCTGCVWTGHEVEDAGYILRTTNGGDTWNLVEYDTNTMGYYEVFFANDTIGYVIGSGGTILQTTDGGKTWTKQTSGTTTHLWGIYFLNSDTGFVVGSNSAGYGGIILNTTDGGTTWTEQDIPTTKGLHGIYFIDENTGWAVGAWAVILSTTNGGETWTEYIWPVVNNEEIREPITRIYPNPADNIINIEIENPINATIEIYNVSGKLVFSKEFDSKVEKIDISGLSGGIYFVKVKQKNNVNVEKLIIY